MLIIEGTDLVGKTTLCHKLAKQLKLIYQHIGPLPDTWTELSYLQLASVDVVRDRYHLSALAYRGLSWQPDIKAPRLLDAELVSRFCAFKVVIIANDENLLKSRWREGELFTMEQILQVNSIYAKMSVFADHRIVLTPDHPFPDEEDVRAIAYHYTVRKEQWRTWKESVKSLM